MAPRNQNKKRKKNPSADDDDDHAQQQRNVSAIPRLLRPTTMSLSLVDDDNDNGPTLPGEVVAKIESFLCQKSRNCLALASAWPLAYDDYLLRIRKPYYSNQSTATGFMTKLTQKGLLPKAFEGWGGDDEGGGPIYIFKETYRNGWKLNRFRTTKCQDWAEMKHPLGFTVEIYLRSLLPIILENDLKKGIIQGKWKWTHGHELKRGDDV